jgi:hypothetical protein
MMTPVMAAVNGPREEDDPTRVQTVYDEERARLRIMLLGRERRAPSSYYGQ